MSRNLNGWIRLDRKLAESDIAERGPETLAVWVHLLLMANYAEAKRYVSGSQIKLSPGQLVTGVSELSRRSGVHESTVRRILDYLKSTGRVTDSPNPKGRVITILKWAEYQLVDEQNDGQTTDSRRASDGPATDDRRASDGQVNPSEQSNPVTQEPGNPENKETTQQGSFFQDQPAADPKPPKKPKSSKPKDPPEAIAFRSKMFDAYSDAIRQRWGTEAQRNLTVNSQLKSLYSRLGEDALEVLKFYVLSNDAFYVKKMHPIGLCLQDAEALHMQWQKGKHITGSMVREFEKSNAFQEKMKRIEEEGI